jgi:ABC-2 type transport system permease protein
MLTLLSESTSNASFGIYMPRFTGAIYELLSAPVGAAETLLGFVGAAALKSLIIAAIILATATLFVDYSIEQLAEPWQTIAQFNPVFYLINGLRWTFMGKADVSIGLAFGLTMAFVVLCIGVVAVIFRTGWRLRG